MTGDEICVRITGKDDKGRTRIVTDDGRKGILNIKGKLKIRKDGYINAWILQEYHDNNIVICGNAYFGKFSISKGISEKYINALHLLFDDVENIHDTNISDLKGAVNRCIKHDQWDWYTTYSYLGYPAHKVLNSFVGDSIKARDAVREGNIATAIEFREKYSFMLHSLWFHLDGEARGEDDDISYSINAMSQDYWSKLLEESKRNLKAAERMKNVVSQYILMHYFVTLEQEFSENYIKPFINNGGNTIQSDCTNKYLETTHQILTGKTHFSLGSIYHLGKNLENERSLQASEALREYKKFLGDDCQEFIQLCYRISNASFDGLTIVEMRNGLAHGNADVIKQIGNKAQEEISAFLFDNPDRIIERIIDGSKK